MGIIIEKVWTLVKVVEAYDPTSTSLYLLVDEWI